MLFDTPSVGPKAALHQKKWRLIHTGLQRGVNETHS
jgi:hypothetical protein